MDIPISVAPAPASVPPAGAEVGLTSERRPISDAPPQPAVRLTPVINLASAPPAAAPDEPVPAQPVPSEPQQPPAEQAPAQPPVQARPATAPPRQSVPDFYGSRASTWEVEAPMDLRGYAIDTPTPQRQLAGKLMSAFLALVVLFLIFVSFRNGWQLSLADLPRQTSLAFSSGAVEKLPEEVEDLEAIVKTVRTLIGRDRQKFLIVQGEVFNNAIAPRDHIVLRGRLLDGHGEMRMETSAPCGKTLDDAEIKTVSKSGLEAHYHAGGLMLNCGIKPDGNISYQLVFVNIPDDYSTAFKVDVKPISAQSPSS